MKNIVRGFQLIELMAVIAIIAILAVVTVPNISRFISRAKRAEAYANLRSIYAAQKAYHAEKGMYATALAGADGAGWKPEGYKGGGSGETFYYTYGFGGGSEGTHYFTGKLNTPASALSGSHTDKTSFVVYAAGDIDNDGKPDVLSIDDRGEIRIVQDDLAD